MSSNASLLLVDADRQLAQHLCEHLSAAGFSCTHAADGEDALADIERAVPELVILDRALRRMSGDELARRIRSNPRTAHVPLIILSATDPADNALVGFDVDAEDYFRKPFSLGVLRQRIEKHLSNLALA